MTSTVTDAWHVLKPPEGDKHGPLSPLLLALTVVTGLVDAFSYLVLGHVFVANMTGNVVFLAFALVGATGFSLRGLAGGVGSVRPRRHGRRPVDQACRLGPARADAGGVHGL